MELHSSESKLYFVFGPLGLSPLPNVKKRTTQRRKSWRAIRVHGSTSVASNLPTTRQTAPVSPVNTTQAESDSEPTMTQVKQRLPKRNVTSNVHEFTSESEDFCDGLSDDPASSDTALPTANFKKGETGPLCPSSVTLIADPIHLIMRQLLILDVTHCRLT